jgi:hypothetical protein
VIVSHGPAVRYLPARIRVLHDGLQRGVLSKGHVGFSLRLSRPPRAMSGPGLSGDFGEIVAALKLTRFLQRRPVGHVVLQVPDVHLGPFFAIVDV